MRKRILYTSILASIILIAIAIIGFFSWEGPQDSYPNGPYPHFTEAAEAIRLNDPARLKAAIERNPDILHYKLTFDRGTLLHFAMTSHPSYQSVAVLIAEGADVHAKDYQRRTPLHIACIRNGDLDAVKLLVKNGVNVNAKSTKGITPIQMIPVDTADELRNYLLEQGAEIPPTNDDE